MVKISKINQRKIEKTDANSLDALGRGASEGLKLAANVAAMLIAFVFYQIMNRVLRIRD